MNKRKIVVPALLSILGCGAVIAGSTYALFTSEAKVNVATNSDDDDGQVIKASSLAEGVSYDISNNDWGEGRTVYNPEFKDK